jgi:hypothetical protein
MHRLIQPIFPGVASGQHFVGSPVDPPFYHRGFISLAGQQDKRCADQNNKRREPVVHKWKISLGRETVMRKTWLRLKKMTPGTYYPEAIKGVG